ncbi:MAG TPA: glycerophosphodiester phosphodiesterase family protein [Xanthomonadales bacterium]
MSRYPDNRLTGFDLQGHRGARGLLPENSIPAFLHALDLGVTTLEMDTVINAEGHVVVSHEPWMSAKICSHPDGAKVSLAEERNLRIFGMNDQELATFDCGSRGHPDFPLQRPMPVAKPLLREVFLAVAAHAETDRTRKDPVRYNIEIKSTPQYDDIFHPGVFEFASLLYGLVNEFGLVGQTTIQSFDTRALEAVHAIDAEISTSLIVDNPDGLKSNLGRLGFSPSVYSPFYGLLDQQQIDAAHAKNIRVIPWTVNDGKTMKELIEMGVDGLITDYPNLGMEVLKNIREGR